MIKSSATEPSPKSSPTRSPAVTYVALLVLATASLLLCGIKPTWLGLTVTLAIAAVKLGLVLWNFMDLSQQPFRVRLAMGASALLLLLLVSLTALDVATRSVRRTYPTASSTFYRR